jgi:hypothetical protein
MISGMKIYILGIDHEIQTLDGGRSTEEKAKFEKLLQRLISEHDIKFVGEETHPEKIAVAKLVASSLDIRWEPIEMSQQARKELGIAEEQATMRYEPIFENSLVVGSKHTRVPSDGIREEYMVWRTLTKAEEAQNILILCGFSHADELRQRFEKQGYQVTLDSLCNYPWYLHPDCPESEKSRHSKNDQP